MHYHHITQKNITTADKIIISGTSLKDDTFLNDLHLFEWIKHYNKPILGICAGMHILGLLFDGQLKKQKQIGIQTTTFTKEFLGMKGKKQVYHLHNYYVQSPHYSTYTTPQSYPQAIKHNTKPFYAVLFHPEVRNKELITQFIHTN